MQLRKLPSPGLVIEMLKLETLAGFERHQAATYCTTGTESQITVKKLKNGSTMLAVVSTIRF